MANSYLLTQPDAAMLIDTGFGKDEPAIRAQIESLIAPGLPLSLFPLRLNEFMSINNVETLRRRTSTSSNATPAISTRRCGSISAPRRTAASILDAMQVTAVTRADTIQLGQSGRAIDVMQAPIRLIATRWLYDRATTHAVQLRHVHPRLARARGRAVDRHRADDDTTSARELRSFMLNTRYWWLEGAPTDSIRRGIGEVFDKYDIETIAPGYGCILRGRKVVARHYRMLDEILKAWTRAWRCRATSAATRSAEPWRDMGRKCPARSRPACSGSATAWRSATRARSITATTPPSWSPARPRRAWSRPAIRRIFRSSSGT